MSRYLRAATLMCLAALITGCGASSATNQLSTATPALVTKSVPAPGGWQPNEQIVIEPGDVIENTEENRYRAGITPDGLPYKIQFGSGSVGNDSDDNSPYWSISCHNDPMSDARSCSVHSHREPLRLPFAQTFPTKACIQKHTFPGRTALMRIDGGTPISTDDRGCVGRAVIDQLTKGKKLVVRFYEWPDSRASTGFGNLIGLASAIELGRFLYKEGERLTY